MLVPDLWTEIVWGSDAGFGVVGRPVHDTRDADVAELDGPVFAENDVLRFDVSVKDLAFVNVLKVDH